MTSRTTRPRTGRPRNALVALGAVGLAFALTACSSSDAATPDDSPSDAAAEADQGAAPQGAPQGGGGRTPGISGEIAAVDGTTAQVQDDESQTAVSWSDDTTVTVTVDGTLADVTVGSCVVTLTGALDGASGDESDATGDTADAATVAVSEPVDDECTGSLGGGFPGGEFPGGGERPEGAPTDLPSDLPELPEGAPTDMPSGAPDGQGGPGDGFGGFGGLTTGLVTAVDGSTITVTTTSPEGETLEESVTVDDATTFTVQRAASGEDVVVGQCVTAQGKSSDDGTFAATSLSISAPGDEGCTSGFPGGRGGFPDGRGGQGEGGNDA